MDHNKEIEEMFNAWKKEGKAGIDKVLTKKSIATGLVPKKK